MSISVVHCKKHEYDVYIGRGKCPKTGKTSKWGNPFTISDTKTRQNVVDEYREWIINQPHLMNSLYELYNKRISCWCKQNPDDNIACHGDILKELVRQHVQDEDTQDLFCETCCGLFVNCSIEGTIWCVNGHRLKENDVKFGSDVFFK